MSFHLFHHFKNLQIKQSFLDCALELISSHQALSSAKSFFNSLLPLLSSTLAMEAKGGRKFVESSSSDSDSRSDYDTTSDDEELGLKEEIADTLDSDSEDEVEADKTPKKVAQPLSAISSSTTTQSSPLPILSDANITEKSPSSKAKKSSGMTRLQEADTLLRVYDALAAYRRPSQQSSLSRKLSSIDSAVSLLQSLRQQLTQGQETIVESNPSLEHTTATQSPSLPKSKPKTSKKPNSKKDEAADDAPKAQKAKPNSASKFFSAERSREILETESGPQLNTKDLKARIDEEWSQLKPEELEIWTSKFLVFHGSLYEKFDRTPHLPKKREFFYNISPIILSPPVKDDSSSSDEEEEPSLTSKEASSPTNPPSPSTQPTSPPYPSIPGSSPTGVVSLNIVNAASIDVKAPPASAFVWKTSMNPRIVGKEAEMAPLKSFKPFAALTSLRKPFFVLALDSFASHLALNDGYQTFVYTIVPGNATIPAHLREKVIFPNRSLACASRISLALSPNATHLYAADSDRYIRKWNLQTYKLEVEVWGGSKDILSLTLSADGNSLAWISEEKHIYLMNTSNMQVLRRYGANGQKRFLNANFSSVALSPNGTYLSAGDSEGIIRTWENDTGHLISHYRGPTGRVFTLFVSETKSFASQSGSGQIRFWDSNAPPLDHTSTNPVTSVLSFDIEERKKLFFVGGMDQLLRIFPWPDLPENGESPISDPYTIAIGHKSHILEVKSAETKEKNLIVVSLSSDGAVALWTL